jgi:hypothetical protein
LKVLQKQHQKFHDVQNSIQILPCPFLVDFCTVSEVMVLCLIRTVFFKIPSCSKQKQLRTPWPHSGTSPHLSRYRYLLKPRCVYSKNSHLTAMWDCGATEYRNRYHDLPIDTLIHVHFFLESYAPLKYSGYNRNKTHHFFWSCFLGVSREIWSD